jgi:hypothetical protein
MTPRLKASKAPPGPSTPWLWPRRSACSNNLPSTFDVSCEPDPRQCCHDHAQRAEHHTVEYGQQYKFTPAEAQKLANGQIVTVTNGVNYLTVAGAIETGKPLYTEWKLSKSVGYDVWGDPNHSWAKSGSTFVTYTDTPVLTYTKAVSAHDILVDLGVAATSGSTKTLDYVARNGALLGGTTVESKATVASPDVDLTLKHTSDYNCIFTTAGAEVSALKTIGGQGALTRVYELSSGEYAIVTIDTYLAQVTSVIPNTHYVAASLTMSVYDTAFTNASSSYSNVTNYSGTYAKGDYALVNVLDGNAFDTTILIADAVQGEVKNGNRVYVNSIAKPVATGALNGWVNQVSTKVGETNYMDACKFGMGYQGVLGTSYDVFADTYGNIIGIAESAKTYTYGIIDNIYWAHSPAEKAVATIVGIDGTKTADVTMTKIGATSFNNNVTNSTGSYATASVSSNASQNGKGTAADYVQHLYMFQGDASATKIVAKGTHATNVAIVTGYPTVLQNTTDNKYYATNSNTVYLVETLDASGNSVYTSYTGYQKVPSMAKTNVCYFILALRPPGFGPGVFFGSVRLKKHRPTTKKCAAVLL